MSKFENREQKVIALPIPCHCTRDMTSAEPARITAYSPDIGWRVVWQRIGMGLTFKEIAICLQI